MGKLRLWDILLEWVAFVWMLPVTVLGALLLILCGGWRDAFKLYMGPVWILEPRAMWMFPKATQAITLGAFILFRSLKDVSDPGEPAEGGRWLVISDVLVHELEHLRQCQILGPFVIVLYPLASFLAWLLYNQLYRGNWFEYQARRIAAGKPE